MHASDELFSDASCSCLACKHIGGWHAECMRLVAYLFMLQSAPLLLASALLVLFALAAGWSTWFHGTAFD